MGLFFFGLICYHIIGINATYYFTPGDTLFSEKLGEISGLVILSGSRGVDGRKRGIGATITPFPRH
jgi:hypothetical protein